MCHILPKNKIEEFINLIEDKEPIVSEEFLEQTGREEQDLLNYLFELQE